VISEGVHRRRRGLLRAVVDQRHADEVIVLVPPPHRGEESFHRDSPTNLA
jgi:hypothetical protein